jgi:hypothetical protein
MADPRHPGYHVPSADGPRADPGRAKTCLTVGIVGAFPIWITLQFLLNGVFRPRFLGAFFQTFADSSGSLDGALVLPCLLMTPIILSTLIRNLQAWKRPTLTRSGRADFWIRVFWKSIMGAIVAGVLLAGALLIRGYSGMGRT